MTLRQNKLEENETKDGESAVAGLTPYWSDYQKKLSMEWRKWSELSAVAMTAKHPIFISEVLRVIANEADRNKALLNNLDYAVGERKSTSVLHLSLGSAARKTFTNKFPTAKFAEMSLQDLMTNCKDTFDTKLNRNLDSFRFSSRKQSEAETLEQFWHSLNGLAAEFSEHKPNFLHTTFSYST